jgi:hypothetical protein
MKSFWMGLPVLIFASSLALPSGVSADTLSQSAVVTVRATVLPARYVIVDERGVITSIITNTSQDVIPTAYLGSISPENARPLTPQLLESYQKIIKNLDITGPGVIYKRPVVAVASARNQQPQTAKAQVLKILQKNRNNT